MADDTKAPPSTGEWTLTLDTPVAYQGGSITELHLKEPSIGQLSKAMAELDGGPSARKNMSMQVSLVCQVTGIARPAVEQIPYSVVTGAANWLLGFTEASPATSAS